MQETILSDELRRLTLDLADAVDACQKLTEHGSGTMPKRLWQLLEFAEGIRRRAHWAQGDAIDHVREQSKEINVTARKVAFASNITAALAADDEKVALRESAAMAQ